MSAIGYSYRTQLEPYVWACVLGAAIGASSFVSPLIPAGVILGAGAAALALSYPVVMCYALIAAVTFLSGMPRGGLIPMLIPNEPLLVVSAGMTFLIVMLRRDRVTISRYVSAALAIMVLGTALIPVIAYYARAFPLAIGDVLNLVAPIQYIVLMWLFARLPRSEEDRYKLVQFMLVCASIVALIGLMQAMRISFISNFIATVYDSHHVRDAAQYGRVTSVLGAWNALGNYLMLNLLIVFSLQGYEKLGRWGKLNLIATLAFSAACLLATGSFASLGGLAAGIVVIKFFDRRGLKLLVLLACGMIVGALLLQDLIIGRLEYQFGGTGDSLVPATFAYRIKIWVEVYLPVIGRNPLWGLTPNFSELGWPWAESQYLYLMVRSGVVSLVAHLLYVIILMGWAYRRIRFAVGLNRAMAIALFTLLAMLSIMGFTNEVFTSSGVIDYMWIMIGLFAVQPKQAPESAAETRLDVPLLPEPAAAQEI